MSNKPAEKIIGAQSHWPVGGVEMGERVRAFDWSKARLVLLVLFDQWRQSFKTDVYFLLYSRCPMLLWRRQRRAKVYNDAYAPVLGKHHPDALGQTPGVGRCGKKITSTEVRT